MNLRPYQREIVSSVLTGWDEHDRLLVISPTGSGKTICFSHIASEFHARGLRSLIIVDQEELVWQALDKLKKATGIIGEAEKAEHRASPDAMVVVATVQTLIRRLGHWPRNHFSIVIADEADKSVSDTWQTVLNHFHAKVCGFTATPHRTDKKNLGSFYQHVSAEIGLFDLIREGYLAPISVKMLPIKIDLSAVHLEQGDFDKNELDEIIGPHLLEVAKAIEVHAPLRKVMVFLPLIKTSEKFVEICRNIGLNAEHIDGKSVDRSEKLKRFENWDFDILANSALLTRGYDDARIDCIVMLRPTKSVTLYTQCIGRGTRIHDCKSDLLLLDFLFASQKHRLVRPANLIAQSDDEADSITKLTEEKSAAMPSDIAEQMDLETLASDASSQREESLRKRLDEQSKRKATSISAEEFAIRHNSFAVAEYEPTMAWESQPVTQKQAYHLKRAKIDLASVKGKGHAMKLLNLHFGEQKLTLASPKVVCLMRRMPHIAAAIGVTDFATVTSRQAGAFFNEMKKRKEAV